MFVDSKLKFELLVKKGLRGQQNKFLGMGAVVTSGAMSFRRGFDEGDQEALANSSHGKFI
jgi:hypothetical protein